MDRCTFLIGEEECGIDFDTIPKDASFVVFRFPNGTSGHDLSMYAESLRRVDKIRPLGFGFCLSVGELQFETMSDDDLKRIGLCRIAPVDAAE